MAADGLRRVLQRSLPALLVILLALVAAPAPSHRSTASHRPAASHAAAATAAPERQPEAAAQPEASPAPAIADRTAALSTQFTAGTRGSRAPPTVSA